MKIISMSGSPTITVGIGVGLIVVGFAYINTLLFRSGVIICLIVSLGSLLKIVLHRKRPVTYKVQKWFLATWSFPSGHSSGSAVAYGVLALIIFNYVQQPWHIIGAILCCLWIVLVGISRVYLGAHYPSDVVAGWLLGLVGVVILLL